MARHDGHYKNRKAKRREPKQRTQEKSVIKETDNKRHGITLTIKKNPFNCQGREVVQTDYAAGRTVAEYCDRYSEEEIEFVYAVNGEIVDGSFVPSDGDFIAICPVVGKDIFRTILTLALTIVTGGLYGAAGTIGFLGATAGSFMAGLISASVMLIGGALINMLCPSQAADTTISADTTATDPLYTWGNLESRTQQGGALAKTYGEMKTAGTILSRHVTTDGTNQYLNVLLTGGEGPIDSISDIRINDNPIGNYDGIVIETRLGTNDQSAMSNFIDSFSDQGLSYELEWGGGWSTQLTEGTATQGLEVTFECPNGLYHVNDDSSMVLSSVTYQLQYRIVGGEWVDLGAMSIFGADSAAIRSTRRIDGLPQGQYEVRCQCVGKSGTTKRDVTRLFWTQITTIIYDDFVRPGKTLVGIRALATSQLSGSAINVTWIQTRSNVWVWTGSAYVQKPATNPAWAAYDYVHGCRLLRNINTGLDEFVVDNVPAARIIYNDFAAWAAHCDVLRLSYNNIVSDATDLWDALKVPEVFGRGKVIQRGTQFGATCDKPGIPVQMFTVGNVANDSYSKEILPITDRANAVEVSFVNKAKNYTKDAFVVYADDYDTDGTIKTPTQITLAGCSDYALGYQHGKYLLRVNKLELRITNWKADIDAIACQYGDQVLLQHDVPQWGEGGRLQDVLGTTLTLDREVTMEAGKSYSILVRLNDDTLVTKSVVTVAGTSNIITVSSAFTAAPQAQDVYSFGLVGRVAKPFIILDVDRDDDKRATLSGIEYVEAVYEESLDAPIVQYGNYDIKDLVVSVTELFPRPSDGTANLSVSWIWPRDARSAKGIVYAGISDKLRQYAVSPVGSLNGTVINVDANSTWNIKVDITDDLGGIIARGSTEKTLSYSDYIPGDVPSLLCESLANGRKRFYWKAVDGPIPIAGYKLRITPGVRPYWPTGQPLHSGLITSEPFETDAIKSGQYVVMIKAVSVAGPESANVAYAIFGLGDELIENIIVQQDLKAAGFIGTKTNCSVVAGALVADNTGGMFYAPSLSAEFYGSATEPFYRTTYKAATYQQTVNSDPGQLLIQSTIKGLGGIYYRVSPPFYSADVNSFFYGALDDPFYRSDTEWMQYTGKVNLDTSGVEVLVDLQAGIDRGEVNSLNIIVDVPDESETLNDVVVSSAGTRLPITKSYRWIKNVMVTIQDSGSGAMSVVIADKDPINGPLVKLFNAAGTQVSGIIDATPQGAKA